MRILFSYFVTVFVIIMSGAMNLFAQGLVNNGPDENMPLSPKILSADELKTYYGYYNACYNRYKDQFPPKAPKLRMTDIYSSMNFLGLCNPVIPEIKYYKGDVDTVVFPVDNTVEMSTQVIKRENGIGLRCEHGKTGRFYFFLFPDLNPSKFGNKSEKFDVKIGNSQTMQINATFSHEFWYTIVKPADSNAQGKFDWNRFDEAIKNSRDRDTIVFKTYLTNRIYKVNAGMYKFALRVLNNHCRTR